MTLPNILFRTIASSQSNNGDSVIVPVFPLMAEKTGATLMAADGEHEALQDIVNTLGLSGSKDELTKVSFDGRLVLLIGVGSEYTDATIEYAAGAVTRQTSEAVDLVFLFPTDSAIQAERIALGALLGAYRFNRYFGVDSGKQKASASSVTVLTDFAEQASARQAVVIAESMAGIKDLVNTPAQDLYPERFAQVIAESVKDLSIECEIWDKARLEAEGCGGILGVGAGSDREPRMVKLSYAPDQATGHLALVGKGITFDTGGLSLKPAGSMNGMKYDMTGAATAAYALIASAALEAKTRVTAWLCLAENMPSGRATRPGDILTTKNGITVEVTNTDAEGRLVLADGLAAASEERPDAIIDIATLTGAATVALGTRHVGLMGNSSLIDAVMDAADEVGESFWHMPLPEYLKTSMKSDTADLLNANLSDRGAGMLFAGVFLEHFIAKEDGSPLSWAHFDIAGTAQNNGSGYGAVGKGPTGVSLRTLVRLAQEFGQA